jgi:ornithine cyclodeaminase/alanine dehydrogenase-like protein (mu-crystallin family)
MKVISAREIDECLDFPQLISSLRATFQGGITTPQRHHHSLAHEGTLLLMPAFNKQYLGTKIVTVFPNNGLKNIPAVQGQYFLQNGETGEAIALLEGKT